MAAVSFEDRFASVGRALDDALHGLRIRTRRPPRPARRTSMRAAVSGRISRAVERSRETMGEASLRFQGESRRRLAMTLLVILSIATTALITWRLAGGRSGAVPEGYWEDVHAVAAGRDHVKSTAPISPEPLRSGNKPGR